MKWNYRVLVVPDGDDPYFDIRSVYYDEAGTPISFSSRSFSPSGNSLEEMEAEFKRMMEATYKPFLWGDERFPQEYDALKQKNHET
jgi:hypothetical protein